MKYKLKFTPETALTCAPILSPEKRSFMKWLLDATTHLYVHRANYNCPCGAPFWFIAARTGRGIRGQFCVECSFKEIPFL